MEMQAKLVDMRKQWKKQGRAELTVRMGLNTGLMVVGNMGAPQKAMIASPSYLSMVPSY